MSAVHVLWPVPTEQIVLCPSEVHVWGVRLTPPVELVRELNTYLSEAEQTRAARFHFEQLQQRFVVSHGALRAILAQYTGLAPKQLHFTSGPFGKPALTNANDVRFNLSHSADLAVVAVTRGHEVGIDVEHVRPVLELERIARSNFALREYAALRALAEEDQHAAFFNCWTRKEAFIKALGTGLSMPLDQFEVSLGPKEATRLLSICANVDAAAQWTLLALQPAAGYVAALALANVNVKLRCWQWS